MTDEIAGEQKAQLATEAVCLVMMGGEVSRRCGRPLHHPAGDPAITGRDLRPVCLMHSVDRYKMSGKLYDDFVREIDSILDVAGDGEAAFDEFVFPQVQWEGKRFRAKCRFDSAVFWLDPELDRVVFERDVSFTFARFEIGGSFRHMEAKGKCNFMGAKFTYQAYFSDVIFGRTADFSIATFSHEAHFERSRFGDGVVFSRTCFGEAAVFYSTNFGAYADFGDCQFSALLTCIGAKFSGPATFEKGLFAGQVKCVNAEFLKHVNWTGASFADSCDFDGAKFSEVAYFTDAKFAGDADFARASFGRDAEFRDAVFSANVSYRWATFSGPGLWEGCKFLAGAQFRGTIFEAHSAEDASAVFALAQFAKPKEVVFDEVDLSRVLFHDSEVSEVRFSPSVRWGDRDNRAGAMICEELIDLTGRFGKKMVRGGSRDYRAVAKIYQQLKKNYDASLDYWTADQFHFGEMEMKRLAVDGNGPLYGLRKWFLPRFGLVAWYRYASDYGNSYGKPLVWMVTLLVVFAALYALPGVGLARSGVSGSETYANVWQAKLTMAQNLGLELELVGRGLLAAIDVAGFQKSPEYSPAYPWGRVLAIVETVLTSTLFGLFLLAIRRQFRR
jgi:uncharacterized protein YjbI with pentapeptide repeats